MREGTNLGDRNATLFDNEGFALCHLAYDLAGLQMELTDRRGLHVTHCNVSLGLPSANAPAVPSVFRNTPPANAENESLRTAPEDWRAQSPEQKAAINQFHIARIAEHFRQTGARVKQHPEDLPLDRRLANYIIEGTKDGLVADLERKRAEGATPLEIINGPLMGGMSEVGRLFNNNELIVAEVLQSAEAMKAAVTHLEQFMEKADTAARGKVILDTVKGDLHDIGKNLVEIILANNGYEVVNLGIKVPPDLLIQACLEHRPDAIGLSGLLVKSTQQMVITEIGRAHV